MVSRAGTTNRVRIQQPLPNEAQDRQTLVAYDACQKPPRAHLEEAVLGEGDEGDGRGGDEAARNRDEGADEHEQAEQAQPRDGQHPHACRRQRRVHHRNPRLHTSGSSRTPRKRFSKSSSKSFFRAAVFVFRLN